jgi:hypothetical protein
MPIVLIKKKAFITKALLIHIAYNQWDCVDFSPL